MSRLLPQIWWRRAMAAGALWPLPGFGVAGAGGATGSALIWAIAGGGLVGGAVVAWRLLRRRSRELATDRRWRSLLALTDSMVWEAAVRRDAGRLFWEFTLLQPSALHRRLVGSGLPGPRGKLWGKLELPDLAAMNERSAAVLASGEHGYEQDFRVRAEGRTYWFHERVAVELLGPDRWRLAGVITDDTRRVEAEQARSISEHRLDRLASQLSAMVWHARVVAGPDGRLDWEFFVPRSELARRLFPDGASGYAWASVGVPEVEEMAVRSRNAVLSSASGYEQDFHVPRAAGDIWLHEQVSIHRLADREWELVGVIVETTQQRLADALRRQEDAQLQELLSAANCLLWRGDVRRRADGELTWKVVTSRSLLFQQIFGEAPEGTACHLDWHRVNVPENRVIDERSRSAVLSGESGYTQEFRVLLPGRLLWLHEQVTITPTGPDSWQVAGVVVDITERRAAEESRRAHQAQLGRILDAVDCMLWQAKVVEWGNGAFHWSLFIPPSRLYRTIFGEEPGDRAEFHWERVADAATDAQIDRCATRAIRAGAPGYEQEFRAYVDGQVHWLHEQVAIESAEPGQWTLVGVITDVTHRHQAEQAELEHQRQLEKLFEVVECLLWRAEVAETPEGGYGWRVFVPGSALFHKLFGPADPDPRTALNWDEAGVAEYPEMQRRSAEALRSGATGYEQAFCARVGGRTYWLFERASIMRTAFNRWELVGVVVDVTSQKQAEAALAAEKERLAVTLRAMAEGVVTTDTEGRVLYANPVALALTGRSVVAGLSVSEVCPLRAEDSGELLELPIVAALRGDRVVDLPLRAVLAAPAGEGRLVEGCCAPIHAADSSIVGTVLVFRDVTERERLEQELIRASKLESVGLLAGGIAHDFNNILTAVVGNLALGLLDLDRESELGKALVEAERAALRARDLTQQLLTFARGGEPIRSAVRLPEIVAEVARFALHGAKAKAEFDLAPDLWPADVDKAQISRVVQNLVLNAVQAMPAGGVVRIMARNERIGSLELPPLAAGSYVRISVADSGVGISPEHLERVFEPYFSTKQTGSGLGLATVYSIVRKHKGLIRVESALGQGTTFHVHLPAAEQGLPLPERNEPSAHGELRGRVLFMDDEVSIRKLATALLRRLGCEIVVTADGLEAVQAFRAAREAGQPFDVVVMDLTVPGGMGGLEALGHMHQIDPEVRAVVSSGYSSDPVLANFREYGFRGRVAKPYELSEFGRVLREVLGGP